METLKTRQIRPGDIPLDGVVLDVEWDGGNLTIRHRHVNYVQGPEDAIQIFGRVSADLLGQIIQAVVSEKVSRA